MAKRVLSVLPALEALEEPTLLVGLVSRTTIQAAFLGRQTPPPRHLAPPNQPRAALALVPEILCLATIRNPQTHSSAIQQQPPVNRAVGCLVLLEARGAVLGRVQEDSAVLAADCPAITTNKIVNSQNPSLLARQLLQQVILGLGRPQVDSAAPTTITHLEVVSLGSKIKITTIPLDSPKILHNLRTLSEASATMLKTRISNRVILLVDSASASSKIKTRSLEVFSAIQQTTTLEAPYSED